jgi:DNA-binding MarR family transcriptional regulator
MGTCEESFWRLISHTAHAMRSYADQRLKKYDLTVEQLQVIMQMDMHSGQPQSVLSSACGKSPANITRILDRLEKKRRIVRRKNPLDRRSSLVFLTEEGCTLRDELVSLFEGLRAELVNGIDSEKQNVAFEVLNAMKKNIEKMSNK